MSNIDLQFIGHRFEWHSGLMSVTYTCMPLTPSSITLYWSKGGDAQAGKVIVGLEMHWPCVTTVRPMSERCAAHLHSCGSTITFTPTFYITFSNILLNVHGCVYVFNPILQTNADLKLPSAGSKSALTLNQTRHQYNSNYKPGCCLLPRQERKEHRKRIQRKQRIISTAVNKCFNVSQKTLTKYWTDEELASAGRCYYSSLNLGFSSDAPANL